MSPDSHAQVGPPPEPQDLPSFLAAAQDILEREESSGDQDPLTE